MEKLFGRAYDSIGSTSSDFLIKTKGQVKVQWGNKFIDIIKNGKLNCNSDILKKVSNKDQIGEDGIYYIEQDGSVILVINGQQISLFGEIGNMYVSYLGKQETTGEQKYQALTNIGFLYKTMEEASQAGLQGGIVYIEDSQKLYIALNGQLIEYQVAFPNPIKQQVVIQKSDSNEGALVIKGTGKENSLVVGDIYIYTKDNTSYIDAPNSINIRITENDQIIIKDNITMKPDVIFDSKVISDNIQSKSATSQYGFRLYMQNGESFLEVDNIIERSKKEDSNLVVAYPIYWAVSNNAVTQFDLDLDAGEVNITTTQECTYQIGDIVVIYLVYQVDSESEYAQYNVVPLYIQIEGSEVELFSGTILNFGEVSDFMDDATDLKDSIIYLVSSASKPIIRIGESNIDLHQPKNYSEISNLDLINTRIGNIKALNKEFTLSQDGKEKKVKPREDISIGIYSEALVSNKSEQFNASLFAPIFKGGPDNDIYPRYDENFEIPIEDDTKTIVTSEWVKKWLRLICPPGTIVQWSGSSVPEGWALCDGSNGTPNLIDKFIKGGTSAGATGGHKEITLTVDNLPSHSHSMSGSAHTSTNGIHRHGIGYTSGELGDNANNRNNIIGSKTTYTDYAGSHSHTIDLSGVSVSSTGNSKPVNIEPQYYTLMYIMKLDY